jgi:hypothetical protein
VSYSPPSAEKSEGIPIWEAIPILFLHPTFEEDPLFQRGVFLNSKNHPSQYAAVLGFNLNTPFAGLIVFFVGITSVTLFPPAFYREWNTVRSDPSIPTRVFQLPS